MKQSKKKGKLIFGTLFFLAATGIFLVQLAYLAFHERRQFEYIDFRLFYLFNIVWVISLIVGILLLLRLSRKVQRIILALALLFTGTNVFLIHAGNQKINQITSVSPDYRHVASIKENKHTGDKMFYRSYYRILGRPVEEIPYRIAKSVKIKWLAKDVAAVTYQAEDRSVQQYIATYGDRSNGISYYQVGAEIQGRWQGENILLESSPEGIAIRVDSQTELFDWEQVIQYGTLALVLMREDAAAWTVSLDSNFSVDSNTPAENKETGTISLYEATMKNNEPITLKWLN